MRHLSFFAGLVAAALLWLSCNKVSPFGSDLLDDQLGNYAYSDTLTLRCTIEQEEEVFTSDRSNGSPYLLVGTLNDPEFGQTTADLYALAGLPGAAVRFTDKSKVDSIVMFLRYDVTGCYGDTTTEQTLRVFQLEEELNYWKEYTASSSLKAGRELGMKKFIPRPSKSDSLAPTLKAPFIRVPLSLDLANEIIKFDSATLVNDTVLYEKIKGFKITCAPSNSMDKGAVLAFNLNDINFSKIRMYFKEDTVRRVYDLSFAEGRLNEVNKFNQFIHNNTGTPAGLKIGQKATDLIYLQGARGIRLKVEMPHVASINDVVINKAELVLTALEPASGATALPGQLAITENVTRNLSRLDSTVLKSLIGNYIQEPISDMYYSLGPTLNGGLGLFGGKPESTTIGGKTVKQYKMSLTDRFQAMVDDTKDNARLKTIYVKIYPNRSFASRAILFGPESTTFPAKIHLKYTNLK
jgi:hypothetical protein